MAVSYRDRFSNYLQEQRNNYAPVGSIFPVSVDSFSGPEDRNGAGSGGQTPEYGYQGYLYCDGRELLIRDYPHLYAAIGNTYGGAPRVEISTNGVAGSIRRTYWINGKMFINFYKDDDVTANDKRPYPYGIIFRFADDTGDTPAGPGLGSLPSSIFAYDTIYGTQEPTEDTSSNTPTGEFAYEILFPDGVDVGSLPQTSTVVSNGTHPNAIISKSFNFRDIPYNVGTFKLPDYRDRVIVGVGGVDGDGSPTVENALINQVGQTGGTWYIDKNTLLDGGLFFSVGDVKTRGYTNIQSDVFTFLTGSVQYRVGPTDDHIFNRPAEHFHNILGSEADELTNSEFAATPVDEFAVMYSTGRANITAFSPSGGGGLPLGHSHGLTKEALNDPSAATYGNTAGIGGYDPTTPADIFWDVSDPELLSYLNPLGDGRIGYDDISLEPHGPGTGEWEGFVKPPIAQSNVYLAFGYGASASIPNPGELKVSRRVEYKLDFTGYRQLYVYAIAGNDNNGGERPNNVGEGLFCEFSNGESLRLFPSVQDFRNENGIESGSEAFDLYDAIHANWKEFVIDIPTELQNQPDQVIVLKQSLSAGSEQGPEVPAGNLNANDMIGIQGIGLRGGIDIPAENVPGVYPITGSQIFNIATAQYDASTSTVLFTLSEQHTFDIGQYVTIGGVSPSGFNGDFEVTEIDGNDNFTVSVDSSPGATAGTGGVARLALGRFEETLVTPAPRLYVVDAATVIGQKVTTVTVPGTGVLFQEEELTSSGTINMSPVSSTSGTVTKINIDLYGPGGGGANSTTDGTDAGYAYATFEIDGQSFTVYAGGGDGGQDGNSGGAGGGGGSVTIPPELLVAPFDEIVTINTQTSGGNGGTGGADGPGSTTGGAGGGLGTGGGGTYETFTQNVSGSWTTYTSSGSYDAGTPAGTVVSRTIQVRAAGAGGGGGNGNANSGCEGSGAVGGSGGPGALVTATVAQSSFSWVLGLGGSPGFNNVDGFVNGTGSEAGPSTGGGGPGCKGGDGATGAWGNGATAGAGGGCTVVYADNGNAIFGAGGGGGGGGSGGGFNGGSTTDGCYAGGNWRDSTNGLQEVANPVGVASGAAGTQGGCTAGGGGGGGASVGPSGSASGGDGGQAGVGHNGNGGGTGGRQGDSAYRTGAAYTASATISSAGNGGSPGNAGGNGYVEVKVDEVQEYAGKVGGAGGGGATLSITINSRNVAVTAGLQSPGGGASTGGAGYVEVRYVGTEGGGDVDGTPTLPAGRYYECDSDGVPSGSAITDNIWKESSADGNVKDNYTKPVSPGTGTGSNTGFVMPGGGNGDAPKYGNRSTKYLPFSGPGTREYIIGPIDTRSLNKLKFSVAKGNNNNGGETPNEDLMVFYRTEGGTTTTLLNAIVTSSETLTGWEEREILISDTSSARGEDIEFIIRQERPASQDDNASVTVDNYGISAITMFFDDVIERTFIPSNGSTIEDVDYVDDTVTALSSGIVVSEGSFEMSSSTPISTTALVSPESNIPLITRYHRAKYLIKAR